MHLLNARNDIFIFLASDSSEFYSTSDGKFQCISKSKIAFSFMVNFASNETTKDVAKLILQTEAQDGDLGGYKVDPNIQETEVKGLVPATRNTLQTEVPNYIFCDPRHYEYFREQLSKKLILVTEDGVSTIDKSQIIFPRHSCGDNNARFKQATFDFYVSVLNEPFVFDKEHTSLAYRVIDQMIYDGSTWKVGLAFDKKVCTKNFVTGSTGLRQGAMASTIFFAKRRSFNSHDSFVNFISNQSEIRSFFLKPFRGSKLKKSSRRGEPCMVAPSLSLNIWSLHF